MANAAHGQRPLEGFRIIEMAGLGPVPLAGLLLAEMGARVLRVERLSKDQAFLVVPPAFDLDRHGRDIVRVDLKSEAGATLFASLIEGADALVEGFRPGVMERLGFGPDVAHGINPRLVYGRMTGFGQDGPLAPRAGHDLTYLAWSGVLHAIGHRDGRPVPPLNLVADYGGGAMFLIAGLLAALLQRERSGVGQVVDAAMVDGAAMLAAPFMAFMATGLWQDRRGDNLLDSGCPFYDTYETSDGLHVAVACLEPQFFAEFARLLPLPADLSARQYDRTAWPAMRKAIETRVALRTRDEWTALFIETDACVAPVLSLAEAPQSDHARARATYAEAGGMVRPVPAPRFSGSTGQTSVPAPTDIVEALVPFGIARQRVEALASDGVISR